MYKLLLLLLLFSTPLSAELRVVDFAGWSKNTYRILIFRYSGDQRWLRKLVEAPRTENVFEDNRNTQENFELYQRRFQTWGRAVSMRNINAILVFDQSTLKIQHIKTGAFLRQHDPDFLDGNTTPVFDNNNTLDNWFDNREGCDLRNGHASRIVKVSATDGDVVSLFEGSQETPFFTNIMGIHQTLANGYILITEAVTGRALETTGNGGIIWENFNIIEPNRTAIVDDTQRLPLIFNRPFFEQKQGSCEP